jgi:hypothetical protein
MFNTRLNGRNNICGLAVAKIRNSEEAYLSQGRLAERLQLAGFDADRHVVRRIENGQRFVTDIELKIISEVLGVPVRVLLDI